MKPVAKKRAKKKPAAKQKTVVVKKPAVKKPTVKKPAVKKPAVNVVDPAVLAVHIYYWSEVWQPHGWKLSHRYKKHLPKDQKHEVERMFDHILMGAEPGILEAAVEALLAKLWTADDWVAAIRDPRLAKDAELEGEELAEWQRRLATLPA